MRELTKSILSFSWAMPLYGMRQMLNMSFPRDMSRPFDQATEGFESVTDVARDQMGATLKGLFDAGDRLQRGLVDLMFSFIPSGAVDPNAWARTSADLMQRSVQGVAQATQATAAAAGAAVPPGGFGGPGAPGGFGGPGAPGGFGGPGAPGGFPGASGMPQGGPAASQAAPGWGPIPAAPTRQG